MAWRRFLFPASLSVSTSSVYRRREMRGREVWSLTRRWNGRLNDGILLSTGRKLGASKPSEKDFSLRGFASSSMMQSMSEGRTVYELNLKIRTLTKSGRIDEAREVFDKMVERNVVSWNSMVSGYAKRGEMTKARKLFDEMPERDVVSWNSMISGYISCRFLEEARRLFDRMPKRDCVSWNTMVSGYAKNRRMDYALQLFDIMPERDVVSWNTVITGFLQNAEVSRAIEFFNRMPRRGASSVSVLVAGLVQNGELDAAARILVECGNGEFRNYDLVPAYNTLISGYGQRGKVHEARKLFDRIQRNLVSWNIMLMCYVKARDLVPARELFDQMMERDNFSWNTMISGYVQASNMEEASKLFLRMPNPDTLSWNSMISGHAEMGSLELARDLFSKMPQKNIVSWNSMIAGYEKNNEPTGAIMLFMGMQTEGVKPDRHTLSSALTVSSGLANLQFGMQIHQLISKTFIPDATINNALITMYSKCGAISEASSVFEEVKPGREVISWNAMIGGFASHGHASEALDTFHSMKLFGVQPTHITFIAALNACAHAGLVDEARRIFNSMAPDYGIEPTVEHFASLVDVVCRHGQLEEALSLITTMPFRPDKAIWGALLGASRVHYNVRTAQIAAEALMMLEPESSAAYVLLHNMYADLGIWDSANEVRLMMEKNSVRKEAAHSWVD